jgi:glycosyltransferase involved in cell wall biosynthesis
MSRLSISIAMTTCNGASYLGEQLTSLAVQTEKPLELVVCDDQSTDETVTILNSFSKLAPFTVRVFQNEERLGYKQNFIKAASLCKGTLIAFCDQDDIWNDDKLSVVTDYFLQSDDLLVVHDYSVFFEDGRQIIPSYFCNLSLGGLLPVLNLKGCSLVFRRKLIDLVDWPRPLSGWSHDMWVCFTALLLEKRGYIQRSLIRHRIHGSNTSGWLKGGNARWSRLLRNTRFPPFTSNTDLDTFIAHFVMATDLADYSAAVQQCGSAMTAQQRQRALSAITKRQALCDFIRSDAYLHPVQRTFCAINLFLRQTYRNGDGLLGLFKDILGSRAWMG